MKKIIPLHELIINPENYRFDAVDTQEQAINLMLEKKGIEIYNLAKDIALNGLDLAKDIRVFVIGEKQYLVLDGNRRITALKCLNDPDKVLSGSLREKFTKIEWETKDDVLKNIQCFVYSTEKEAAKWIKLDHTGKNSGVGQDPWGAPEIDRFSYKFEGKISPAMQAITAVEKTKGIKFDKEKLKITTINRILSNPESRSYLGIDIVNKHITYTAKRDEAIDRMATLFYKIIKEDVPVARVYTTGLAIKFMKDLFQNKPTLEVEQKKLFPTDKNHFGESQGQESKTNDGNDEPKQPGTFAKKDWVTDTEYRQYQGSDKVKSILKEMKLLDPESYPHILMPSIRVVLELALYYKLEEKGFIKKMTDDYKKKGQAENIKRAKKGAPLFELTKNWSPSFREMLKYCFDEKNGVISDPQARKALDQMLQSKDNENFLESLNSFIHNVHNIPGKSDPENMWRKYGRVLLEIIKKI